MVIVVGRPIGKIGWSWAGKLMRLDFFHGYIRTGAYERSATSVRDGRTERPCVESCNRRKVPSRWRQSEASTWLSLDISAAGDGSGDTHHARVVEDTLRMAQDLLREQLQSGDPYHTIAHLRTLVRSKQVQSALRHADTFLAATLRAVRLVVADDSRDAQHRIGELWRILDQPAVNAALGFDRSRRMTTDRR